MKHLYTVLLSVVFMCGCVSTKGVVSNSTEECSEENIDEIQMTGDLVKYLSQEEKAELRQFAKQVFNEKIESLYLPMHYRHPSCYEVAFVNFPRRQIEGNYFEDSYAKVFHKDTPPPESEIQVDKESLIKKGSWMTDGIIVTKCMARYILTKREIYLSVPPEYVSYECMHVFLKALESKKNLLREDGEIFDYPLDFDKMHIYVKKEDGKIFYVVNQTRRPCMGTTFKFVKEGDNFRVVRISGWVA